MRVANVPLRRTFFSTLDSELEIISTIVKERGGSSGKKIAADFLQCTSVVSYFVVLWTEMNVIAAMVIGQYELLYEL